MTKEKRIFKRRTIEANLTLTINGHNYAADVANYSFDGICAVAKGLRPVREGDYVIMDLKHYCVRCSGRIIWSSEVTDGIKLGIHREGLLYASLEDFLLPDILLGLQRSGRTGEFHMISNTVHKTIYIKNGDIDFASSNQTSERFGRLLLRETTITMEEYQKAQAYIKIHPEKKRLGTVLSELGFIQQEELDLMVKKHVESITLSLFELQEGEYMFKESPLAIEEPVTLKLSTANLIYRGITSLKDESFLRNLCPSGNTVLFFSEDPLDLFQDLKLEDSDKKILSSIDEGKTISDIISGSPLNEFETLKILYALLSTRIIAIQKETDKPTVEAPLEEVITEEESEVSTDIIEDIEYLHKNYRDLGYYGVMDIGKDAPDLEIKKAYYKKAKEFHPDRHYDLPGNMKDKLNDIFTYITTAYSTLINTNLRREYDLQGEEKPVEVDNKELAKQKFNTGKKKYQNGNFEEAERLFSEAAYLDSSIPNYHFYRAMAFTKNDKHKDAERAMRRALKSEPFNSNFLAEAGHVFLSLGFHLKAKGNFERALKIIPNQKRALEGMAKIK